jgi:hypothetical protein
MHFDIMATLFNLLCYVYNGEYKQAFEVKIGMEESFATPKKAIKAKAGQA